MFQLDLKSRKSIYEQVMDNLKELIMTGTLAAGDKLVGEEDIASGDVHVHMPECACDGIMRGFDGILREIRADSCRFDKRQQPDVQRTVLIMQGNRLYLSAIYR